MAKVWRPINEVIAEMESRNRIDFFDDETVAEKVERQQSWARNIAARKFWIWNAADVVIEHLRKVLA